MSGPTKKVVRVNSPTPPAPMGTGSGAPSGPSGGGRWTPTAEAKSQATTFRIVALVLWAIAIGLEAFAIFYVLKQHTISTVLLVVVIIATAACAIIGSQLWKRANELDPASTAEPARFFIQNQLGAIIAVIAFLPLIVMILTNKNMSQQQKGVAGSIGVVALLVAGLLGASFNPPSVEQNQQQAQSSAGASGVLASSGVENFPDEANVVKGYTGQDLVFWTKDGTVYHLCQGASALQHESQDNTIYSGTVTDAHNAGKNRLTLQVSSELNQCGLKSASPS
nr:hypothetical protein [Actinomycetota bacterium]